MSSKRRKLRKIKKITIRRNTSLFADSMVDDNGSGGEKCDSLCVGGDGSKGDDAVDGGKNGVNERMSGTDECVTYGVDEGVKKDCLATGSVAKYEKNSLMSGTAADGVLRREMDLNAVTEQDMDDSSKGGIKAELPNAYTPQNAGVEMDTPVTTRAVVNQTGNGILISTSDCLWSDQALPGCNSAFSRAEIDHINRSIQSHTLTQSQCATDRTVPCGQKEQLNGPVHVMVEKREIPFSGENGALIGCKAVDTQEQSHDVTGTDGQSLMTHELNGHDTFMKPILCSGDFVCADQGQKGEQGAQNLKEQTNKTVQIKEHMKKENDYVQEDAYDDGGLITQCEASEVLLRLSEGRSEHCRSDGAQQGTSNENGAQDMGDYRESTSNENDGGYKDKANEYSTGLVGTERHFAHEDEKKVLSVIAHEKLRNETLREENAHLKAIICEIKALIKMKNQNISALEQRVNFLECEKKLRDTDRGVIENGLELVDKLKVVYQDEVRMFCRKMEKVRRENTVLKGNYDMLKKTVAELLKERRDAKEEY